jgi:hypothetical protein
MQHKVVERVVEVIGDQVAQHAIVVGGSAEASSLATDMLIDNYSDPLGSIVREIVSNGHDSVYERNDKQKGHRNLDPGDDLSFFSTHNDVEIQFTGESSMRGLQSQLIITDWGNGMSPDRVIKVYLKLGESTKKNNNTEIGGFGIGAKCPFTYTDVFTMTSFYNGLQYDWLMTRTNSGISCDLLTAPIPCTRKNGVRVCIPIKTREDAMNFAREVNKQLMYFNDITVKDMELVTGIAYRRPTILYDNSILFIASHGNKTCQIVVGIVPYDLDCKQLDIKKLHPQFNAESGYSFRTPIGSVALHSSRERLIYNSLTKDTLIQIINDGVTQLIEDSKKYSTQTHDFMQWLKLHYQFEHAGLKTVRVASCTTNTPEAVLAAVGGRPVPKNFEFFSPPGLLYTNAGWLSLLEPFVITKVASERAVGGFKACRESLSFRTYFESVLLHFPFEKDEEKEPTKSAQQLPLIFQNGTHSPHRDLSLLNKYGKQAIYGVRLRKVSALTRKAIDTNSSVPLEEIISQGDIFLNWIRNSVYTTNYDLIDIKGVLDDKVGEELSNVEIRKAANRVVYKEVEFCYNTIAKSYRGNNAFSFKLRRYEADLEVLQEECNNKIVIYGTMSDRTLLEIAAIAAASNPEFRSNHYDGAFRYTLYDKRICILMVSQTLAESISTTSAIHINHLIMSTTLIQDLATNQLLHTRMQALRFFENFADFNQKLANDYKDLQHKLETQYSHILVPTNLSVEVAQLAHDFNLIDQDKMEKLSHLEQYAQGVEMLRYLSFLQVEGQTIAAEEKAMVFAYLQANGKEVFPKMDFQL